MSFNVSLQSSDPVFSYDPDVPVGWHPIPACGQSCDPNIQFLPLDFFTSITASFVELEFSGSAVYLYGNTNCTFNVDITIGSETGTEVLHSDLPSPTNGTLPTDTDILLFSMDTGLDSTQDYFILLTNGLKDGCAMRFRGANVTAPYNGTKPPTLTRYNSIDTNKFTYTGNWTNQFRLEVPDTANPQSFQQTNTPGSFATMNFTGGVAVGVTGVALPGLYHYNIELTDLAASGNPPAAKQFQGNASTEVTNATLFYQAGLDPSKNYQLKLLNSVPAAPGNPSLFAAPFAFSYVTVYSTENTISTTSLSPSSTSGVTTTPPSTPAAHSTNIGAIVGPIIGGLALIACLVFAFLWRRRRKERDVFVMNNLLRKGIDDGSYVTPFSRHEGSASTEPFNPYSDNVTPSASAPQSFGGDASQSTPGSKRKLILRQDGMISSPATQDYSNTSEPHQSSAPSSHSPPSSTQNQQPVDMERLEALIEQRVNERIERMAVPYTGQEDGATAPPPYPRSNVGHS